MLILLDIDGVMVPANPWKRPEFLEDGFPAFSQKAVAALNRLLLSDGAAIVLTTSHKSKYTIPQWKQIFRLRGVNAEYISRLPENTTHLNRKEEILNWVATQAILPDFIIIDDDKSLNGLPAHIKENIVQTSGAIGLTSELLDEAMSVPL